MHYTKTTDFYKCLVMLRMDSCDVWKWHFISAFGSKYTQNTLFLIHHFLFLYFGEHNRKHALNIRNSWNNTQNNCIIIFSMNAMWIMCMVYFYFVFNSKECKLWCLHTIRNYSMQVYFDVIVYLLCECTLYFFTIFCANLTFILTLYVA